MIITSTNRQPVRIIRSVTNRSDAELDVYKTVHEHFPRIEATLRPYLGTTIIEASETSYPHRSEKKSNFLTGKILPIPATGTRNIELTVNGVAFMGTHLGYRALVLLLDDPENILASERIEYLRRMGRPAAKRRTPHVSLMNVDAFFATSELLTWAEQHTPQTIGLRPISSMPEAALEEELARAPRNFTKTKSRPHWEGPPVIESSRTLGPNLIPDSLIKSLQARQRAETSDQTNAS